MAPWALHLVVSRRLPASACCVAAGRTAPPGLTIDKPDRRRRPGRHARGHRRGAERALHDADDRARAERPDHSPLLARRARAAAIAHAGRSRSPRASRARSANRASPNCSRAPRASSSPRRALVPEPAHALEHGGEGLSGQARAAARSPSSRRTTTSTTAGPEMVVYRATPADVASGVRVGDVEYPGFPVSGAGVAGADPSVNAAFFALLYDQDLEHADRRLRARRGGQRSEGDVRRQRLREAAEEEPHRARRQVHRPRRARNPRAFAGAEDGAAAAGGDMLPAFLSASTASSGASTPARSPRSRERRRRRSSGRGRSSSSATRRSRRRSPITAPTSTRARKSTSRCTSGSTWRSPAACRSSRPTPARCSTPAGSASTATASSSTTGWACSRSTAICRRSTSRWATPSQGPDHRAQRDDRPGRRRSSALHDAGERPHGEPGRVVGPALDRRIASSGSWAKRAPARLPRNSPIRYDKRSFLFGYALIFRSGEINASTKRLGQRPRIDARGVGGRCGAGGSKESSAPAESSTAAAGGQKVDAATAGDVNGIVTFDGAAPKNEPIKMNADPVCVKENTDAAVPGNLRGRQRRQVARQRVRVREGRPRQLRRTTRRPTPVDDRSEELPLPSARVRHARRPAARNRQQRSDAAQHPRAAEGQRGVQQRPADSGHED